MKLKYFLRGLGAGIVFATVIMLAAYMTNGGYKMSDEEIIRKAEKLGMVMRESYIATSSDADTSDSEDNAPEDDTTDEDSDESHTQGDGNILDKPASSIDADKIDNTDKSTTESTTEKATTESTTEKTTTESTTEKTTTESTEEQTTTESTSNKPDESITIAVISVTPGMSSTSVAYLLQESGIISDYLDFDRYLDNNGYSKRIQVKSATYRSDMSYEEIAKLMTGR